MSEGIATFPVGTPSPADIQTWFEEAAPDWPTPTLELLKPLASYLSYPVFHNQMIRDEFLKYSKKSQTRDREIRAAARLLLEEVNGLARSCVLQTGNPIVDERAFNEMGMALNAMPYLENASRERDYLSEIFPEIFPIGRARNERPDWHCLAFGIFELAWQAWEEAGHFGPIGRNDGTPGLSIVSKALEEMRLPVGLSPSSVRDALKGWRDPLPIEGGYGEAEMERGKFKIENGKRIYPRKSMK